MSKKRMIDVGANLLDEMFKGNYNGSNKHPADLQHVLDRAFGGGLTHIICTAGNLKESRDALKFCQSDPRLYCTVGVHPTRTHELNDDKTGGYVQHLIEVAKKGVQCGKVVAIGECGLDFDRVQFSDRETQLKHFERHFEIFEQTGKMLPLFLHNRGSTKELHQILLSNRHRWKNAVVHSYDDTNVENLKLLLSLGDGLYIGLNGCSMKTQANLDIILQIPLDRILIETDSPWCGIKKTHASYEFIQTQFEQTNHKKHCVTKCVKGRSEPCHIVQVLECLAGIKNEPDVSKVSDIIYGNTLKVFFPSKQNATLDNNMTTTLRCNDESTTKVEDIHAMEVKAWTQWLLKQHRLQQ